MSTQPTAPEPCAWQPVNTVALGEPCPYCGHTSLAHPGPANPALSGCALCAIAQAVAELRATTDGLRVDVDLVTDVVAELTPIEPTGPTA